MFARKPQGAPDGGRFAAQQSSPPEAPLPPPTPPAVPYETTVEMSDEEIEAYNGPRPRRSSRPPWPRSGRQILAFWTDPALVVSDEELDECADMLQATGAHRSSADAWLRMIGAATDATKLKASTFKNCDTVETDIVLDSDWPIPSGSVLRIRSKMEDPTFRLAVRKGITYARNKVTTPPVEIAGIPEVAVVGPVWTHNANFDAERRALDVDERQRIIDSLG